MKNLLAVVLIVFFAVPVSADTWCQWSGTEGTDCKSDRDGVFRTPFPTRSEATINEHGYYRLVVTQPTLGENQVRDEEVWAFEDNVITKTWTVRDLTAQEINEREAGAMPLSEYYLWKVLRLKNVVTTQELQDNLPEELKDAYLARKALLGD